jgi:hypothetical protein
MSSRLSQEIAKLATEARGRRIQDHETIEKLTLVIGYGHLAESHPKCWRILQKHLHEFIALIHHEGEPELCQRSEKILEIAEDLK